jgi:hypothetical protein
MNNSDYIPLNDGIVNFKESSCVLIPGILSGGTEENHEISVMTAILQAKM